MNDDLENIQIQALNPFIKPKQFAFNNLTFVIYVISKMIAKVRLQRKFKSKNQHSYASSICLIIKTQIVFELLVICFTCLLNLSLQFHLSHIFTCQFWNNEQIASYNIAFFISCILMSILFLQIEKLRVSMISDAYFSCIFIHTLFSLLYNWKYQFTYFVYVSIVGMICSSITKYLGMVLQQKKLIQQICEIQSQDRKSSMKTMHQENQQSGLTTFESDHI